MVDFGHLSDDNRREELIRVLEHSLERLSLQELEALYYDMTVKDYIREGKGEGSPVYKKY